jgi:outer membrane immunogenic protein
MNQFRFRLIGAIALALTTWAIAEEQDTAQLEPTILVDGESVTSDDSSTYDWGGWYAGVVAGRTTSDFRLSDENDYNSGHFDYNDEGEYVGLLGGYNVQWRHLVGGVEAEFSHVGLNQSAQYPDFIGSRGSEDSVAEYDINFYTALSARFGFAMNRCLFYVKGGIAAADVDVSFIDNDTYGLTLDSGTSKSSLLLGYTLGGGLEFACTEHWLIRGEYTYSDFGTVTHTATTSNGYDCSFSHDIKNVYATKLALVYKW